MNRVRVARFDEIEEGKCKTVETGGRTIAVFKVDGALFAIDDECPHRAGPLSLGVIEQCGVVCPLHAWTFDLETGVKRGQATYTAQVYEVIIENGEVWVGPEKNP